MNIRLVSTLTPEDEARIAEALCLAAGTVLDHLEIAYTLRIETTDGQVYQQHKTPPLAAVRASSSAVAT
jgi:hypothetical protein